MPLPSRRDLDRMVAAVITDDGFHEPYNLNPEDWDMVADRMLRAITAPDEQETDSATPSQGDPVSDAIVVGHARDFWQGRALAAEAEVERLRGLVEIIASNLDSVMPDSAATIRAALWEEAKGAA